MMKFNATEGSQGNAMARLNQEVYSQISSFWELLKENIDKLPKRDAWKMGVQWSTPLNGDGDKIAINFGDREKIWIYVRSGDETGPSSARTLRMLEYSRLIRKHFYNLEPFRDKGAESKGRSIGIQRSWMRSDQEEWPGIALWVKEQFEKLEKIVSSISEEESAEIERIESEEEDRESSPPMYRVTTYPADYTLEVLHRKWISREIQIPAFQRNFVWTQTHSSKLIESFLVGLPVPAVFLYFDRKNQNYLIIDGQQRLKSIFYYFEGVFGQANHNRPIEFSLKGLHDQSEYSGKTFDSLDESDQMRLKNSTLRTFIVKQDDPDDDTSMYQVFERLNTGGIALSNQEIRDCVYHGKLTESLHSLNKLGQWRDIFGNPLADARKRDVELILRFFAMRNVAEYKRPMKMYLSSYMNQNRNLRHAELTRLEQVFEETCTSVLDKLGHRPFHVRKGLNAAVLDAVMVAFSKNLPTIPNDIKIRFKNLVQDEEFDRCTRNNTTDYHVVEQRFRVASSRLFGN